MMRLQNKISTDKINKRIDLRITGPAFSQKEQIANICMSVNYH